MSTEAETSQDATHHHDPAAMPLKPILKHADPKYAFQPLLRETLRPIEAQKSAPEGLKPSHNDRSQHKVLFGL